MSGQFAPIEVFYSYADADEALRCELDKHLSQLRHDGLITTWHKRQIVAGTDWNKALDQHLNTASAILLLVSSDFVASDYCYGIEMQQAMKRHDAGETRVIPILLRPVDWQSAPFGKLQSLPSNQMPITKWRNRDAAFTNVAQGIRTALQDIQRLTSGIPPTAFPRIWNVPFARNPFFTGRDKLLTQITTSFQQGSMTALSQPQALSGLGGVGKTQLAIEYAYRHRQDYRTVLWVVADSLDTLYSEYLGLADILKLPKRKEDNQSQRREVVKQWLCSNGEWLLILDNVENLSLLSDFLPSRHSGHVLLTTRIHAIGEWASRIEVNMLDQQSGTRLLLYRAGMLAQDKPLSQAKETERLSAQNVWNAFGGLPLALDQAGAYVEETGGSFAYYFTLYQQHKSTLLAERGLSSRSHPASVFTTLSLIFAEIEQRFPPALDLLYLCTFLNPENISGAILSLLLTDSSQLDKAKKELLKYSLLKPLISGYTYTIHRLVQDILQVQLDQKTHRFWVKQSARLAARLIRQKYSDEYFAGLSQSPHYYVLSSAAMGLPDDDDRGNGFPTRINAGEWARMEAGEWDFYPVDLGMYDPGVSDWNIADMKAVQEYNVLLAPDHLRRDHFWTICIEEERWKTLTYEESEMAKRQYLADL